MNMRVSAAHLLATVVVIMSHRHHVVVRAVVGQAGEAPKKVIAGLGVAGVGATVAVKAGIFSTAVREVGVASTIGREVGALGTIGRETGALGTIGRETGALATVGREAGPLGRAEADATQAVHGIAREAHPLTAASKDATEGWLSASDDVGRGATKAGASTSPSSSLTLIEENAAMRTPALTRELVVTDAARGLNNRRVISDALRETPITVIEEGERATDVAALDEDVIRQRVATIFNNALSDVPGGVLSERLASERELADALKKALIHRAEQPQRQLKYDLDVSTGKLKISYDTARGRVTGEIDAYSIVKKVAGGLVAGGASGAGWAVIQRRHDRGTGDVQEKPTAGGEQSSTNLEE